MKDLFKGQKLLITGGTGSFGNAVLKKFISSDFSELRILVEMKKSKMICGCNI